MPKYFSFIFVFLFFPFLLMAKQENGSLNYQSDFNTVDRLQLVDGSYITAHYQLSHQETPPGAYDGDSGSEFYLKIKNESLLVPGKTYNIQDPSFDVIVVEWASPAGYKKFLQNQLTGTFTILDYQQHQHLKIDLKMGNFKKQITFKAGS